MASVLDAVDLRTQLVGENRLELLMFRLHGDQLFAINVFKVQEVQQMPALTLIPYQHPIVVGVTHVRGATIPVIDLSKAINMAPMDDYTKCNIIITEYNMSVIGTWSLYCRASWWAMRRVRTPSASSGMVLRI